MGPAPVCELTGKASYGSRAEANVIKRKARGRGTSEKRRGHLAAFPCAVCKGWHLGHVGTAAARRKRRRRR